MTVETDAPAACARSALRATNPALRASRRFITGILLVRLRDGHRAAAAPWRRRPRHGLLSVRIVAAPAWRAVIDQRGDRESDEGNVSDELNPPTNVDRRWAMREKWNDRQGHDQPHERSVKRGDFDWSQWGRQDSPDPGRARGEQQEHGGPAERHAEMHEDTDRRCACSTIEC